MMTRYSEKKVIAAERNIKERDYWLNKFSGEFTRAFFYHDYQDTAVNQGKKESVSFLFTGDLAAGLRKLSKNSDHALHVILFTGIVLLLDKYTNLKDIVIGTPIYKQDSEGEFINTVLAIRILVEDTMSFKELLITARDTVLQAVENQNYPLETLLYKLNMEPAANECPLFDVMVLLENVHDKGYIRHIDPNMIFSFICKEETIEGILEYNPGLYMKTTIERIIKHFTALLRRVLVDIDAQLPTVPIVSAEERKKILFDFNNTGKELERERCYQQLFQVQAAKTPDSIAALHDDRQITYSELNKKSNQLAALLREKNVTPNRLVAIGTERSLEMLLGILGTFKAGGAYLPFEVDAPPKRIRSILEESEAEVLLTASTVHPDTPAFFREICSPTHVKHVVNLDKTTEFEKYPGKNPTVVNQPSDLSYVIYTSGTTGKPKGVMIHHLGMLNHLYAKINDLSITAEDMIAQTAPAGFDISVWQFLAGLLVGGTTLIVAREIVLEPERFLKVLRERRVTIWESVPSLLTAFLQVLKHENEKNLEYLRWMLLTGEPLNPRLAAQWYDNYPGIKLLNAYGPTEASDDVTHYLVKGSPQGRQMSIPIGKPIQNTHIYILDRNLSLCPVGVRGEICVAGIGVGKGYWQDPVKTAKSFPENPFKNEIHSDDYARLYKTGDIGFFREDGNIECLGRLDHQVKIRGNRIELGEIESHLLKHMDIMEAVVVVRTLKNESTEKYLCAYVVADRTLQAAELQDYLAGELPEYMVPSYFIQLEKIPLTTSGKLDRQALPEPTPALTKEYIAPQNKIEKKLTTIWSEVLAIEKQELSTGANFFDLGGHSLRATIMATKIHKQLDVKVPLIEIFKYPTIRDLAKVIKNLAKETFLGIEPVEKKEYYQLSSAQNRLYVLQQMELDSTAYNIPQVSVLEGELDNKKPEEIFKTLIHRHESFRTSFMVVKDEPVQRIHPEVDFEIEYYAPGPGPYASTVKDFIRPFDLTRAPLFRAGIIKQGNNTHILLTDIHHIVADGTSIDILMKEFMKLYRWETLPAMSIQYKDFSVWQNKLLAAEEIKQQEKYWLEQFAGENPVSDIPIDYPRPPVQSFAGASINFELDTQQTLTLKSLAAKENVTLFMALVALFNIFLAKISSQEDIVIGIPIEGRRHADLQNLIGMFVNTLVLRNQPSGEKTIKEFFSHVKENTLQSFENQEYQFEQLVNQVEINRDVSRNPLFDVILALQMESELEETQQIEIPGLKLKSLPPASDIAKFDLQLSGVEAKNDRMYFQLSYSTALFKNQTIERYIGYFKGIVTSVLQEPQQKISQLEIISPEEKKRLLYEFSQWENPQPYTNDKTIPGLFAEQVQRTPGHIALLASKLQITSHKLQTNSKFQITYYNPISITYKELNEKADQLAHLLRQKGVKPGTIVALMVERSIEMLIGILAILKTGGAYVPLNPKAPEARNQYILAECNIAIVVSMVSMVSMVSKACEVIYINDIGKDVKNLPTHPLTHSPTQLCYVIFTSGSTGEPKGAAITHANFSPLLHWGYKHLGIGPGDSALQNLAYYFDWSVWEIFITLTTGACLYIVPEDILVNPGTSIEFMEQHDITVLHVTPTQCQYLVNLEHKIRGLKYLFIGAEKLTYDLVQHSFALVNQDCRLFNMYGPTEATIISTVLEIRRRDYKKFVNLSSVPIGTPVANQTLLILDKYFKLCPVNIVGELYIGGHGVARGYLNNPELTAEKFIKLSPHSPTHPLTHSSIYRTGDLARWLPDGNIVFLGRVDFQVKIRGFRIEPGEIENQLLEHKHIKEAIVEARDSEDGDKYLCAYIVEDQPGVLEKEETLSASLRKYLQKTLPDHMIPAYFIRIDKIPLNPNGKVDRRALPAPLLEIKAAVGYAAPRDAVEETLVRLWSEILNIKPVQAIGINDNFFERGGHSLKATLLVSKIEKEFQVKLPLTGIFKTPTIKGLAGHLKSLTPDLKRYSTLEIVEKKEYYALSSAQKRLFVLQRMELNSTGYNVPQVFVLQGEPVREKMAETFKKLLLRHESLRTSIHMVNGQPVQRIHDIPGFEIEYYDLATEVIEEIRVEGWKGGRVEEKEEPFDPKSQELRAESYIKDFIRPFDLSHASLLRVGLAEIEKEKFLLLLDMHHIITDGISMGILMKEFMKLYCKEELSEIRHQYKDFSEWQNSKKVRESIRQQGEYWLKEFEDEIPVLDLPTDFTRPTLQSFEGSTFNFEIDKENTTALKKYALEEGITLFMVLLTIYYIFLSKITRQEDIVVGIPIASRRHTDLEQIIGMFVNTLALRNFPCGEKDFRQFPDEVKNRTLKAFANQDYQYEELVEKIAVTRDTGRNPLFDTMFTLQNIDIPGIKIPGLNFKPRTFDQGISKVDLSLQFVELENTLVCGIEYSTKLFKTITIEKSINHIKTIISIVMENPAVKISDMEIISEEEKKRILLEFNDTEIKYPSDNTIDELFEEVVEKSPDRTAVISYLNLIDIYEKTKTGTGEIGKDLRGKFENLCFKKNLYIFKFENSTILKWLDIFTEEEKKELIMLRTHQLNYVAVNNRVLLLLDYFDGKTNIKSIFKGLPEKNVQFLIYNIEKHGEESDFYPGTQKRIVLNSDFKEIVLLINALYDSNLIGLMNYSGEIIDLDVQLHGDEEKSGEKAVEADNDLKEVEEGNYTGTDGIQKTRGGVKSPVLLLGERTGQATTGLLYIASFLRRNGIEAYCRWNDPNHTIAMLKNDVEELLITIKPQVVGVSMKWFPHIARTLEICKIIKEFDPFITIVVGGNTASYYKEKVIRCEWIDYVVLGDGELPFLKICLGENHIPNCVYKKDREIIETPITYIQNEHNSSDVYLSHLDEIFVSGKNPYLAPYFYICTGKGCLMQCFYCGGCRDAQIKVFNRDKPFMRGVKEVRSDIIAAKKYTTTFWFDFDLPAYDSRDYYKEIWRGIDLSNHFCEFYFWKLPTFEFLDFVVKTFKYIYINIDLCSLSEPHRMKLSSLGVVKPQPTDEELFLFFDHCAKYDNVEVIINQITGLPYFTSGDIQKSDETLSKLLSKYSFLKAMDWGRLHAQPGAPIVSTCEQYGMHSYAKSFEDFLLYSQLNLKEKTYPVLLNFHYPYIYSKNEHLNSKISKFYADTNEKIEKYEKEKERYLNVPVNLTYAQLDERANRLAIVLRDKGVGPGVVVGVMLERSAEMIAALLAVLISGGAYLPIDPDYPGERIKYMLADSNANALVTTSTLAKEGEKLRSLEVKRCQETIFIDTLDFSNLSSSHLLNFSTSPSSLAYILYTSGSTGRPKGVMVEHRNVVRLVKNSNYIEFAIGDRLLLTGNIVFDITTFEIWGSLLNTITLYLADQNDILDGGKLKEILAENRINILHLVPQLFNQLASRDLDIFAGLDYLLVGGDLVSPEYVNKVRKTFNRLKILHMYGPTENTTFSTFYPVDKDFQGSIPIGKPISNSYAYVVDRTNKLLPIGTGGELVVGGDGIARGYLNNPELTAKKFGRAVNNQLSLVIRFSKKLSKSTNDQCPMTNDRLYKTGDLVRWLEDGNIEFLGRIDHQVKIRGIRIEPGEIENQLVKHEEIKEAVVIISAGIAGSRPHDEEDKYLCAYIVSESEKELPTVQLREFLQEKLPGYMIPIYFVQLEEMPLIPNGKIDRKALPQPGMKKGTKHTPPRNEIEKKLVDLWSEVLGLEKDIIDIDTNFFQLGGHSLTATTLAFRIQKEFNIHVPLAELFKKSSIRLQGDYIETAAGGPFSLQDDYLVLIRQESENANHLFLVHDGTGEVEGYIEFCNRLNIGFNCWGIRVGANRLENLAPLDCTIEELAQTYIEKIKKIQPYGQGPYCIVGWSLGGTIAFEIALQLEKMSEKVSFLGLVDSPGPQQDRRKEISEFKKESELDWLWHYLPNNQIKEKVINVSDINEIWSIIVNHLEENNLNVEIIKRVIPDHLVQLLPNYHQLGIRELIYHLNLNRTLTHARAFYIPSEKIRTTLQYFKANQSSRVFQASWNDYCINIKSYEIPGDHFSIFKPPHVDSSAKIIENAIFNNSIKK